MLDIKWIREKPEALVKALIKRGNSEASAQETVDAVIQADEERRAHLGKLQEQQEARNQKSKEIGNAMRSGDMVKAEALKGEVNEIKTWLSSAEQLERDIDDQLRNALAVIPNVPLDEVPVGKDEHDNVEVRRWGAELISARQKNMPNKPKEHFEIGEALGMMDFERAAKLSGSRFTVLKGQLARLERALGQFMLDLHTTEHGYTEVQPPLMVRDEAMFGTGNCRSSRKILFRTARTTSGQTTLDECADRIAQKTFGQLPAVKEEYKQLTGQDLATDVAVHSFAAALRMTWRASKTVFADGTKEDRLWLIPTAEVPLTNLVREEITPAEKLPLRFTALTPCFRSEAGSAGRDTRGMLRQHQFYKVEMVSITKQESSLEEHERMTAMRRGSAEAARPAVPHGGAVHRRHGFRLAQDLRHRGLAAWAERLSRDFLLLGLRRFPGPAHGCPLSRQGREADEVRPHAEWVGRRGRPRADRRAGKLSERGRLGHNS